jgi:hypothetical protein
MTDKDNNEIKNKQSLLTELATCCSSVELFISVVRANIVPNADKMDVVVKDYLKSFDIDIDTLKSDDIHLIKRYLTMFVEIASTS